MLQYTSSHFTLHTQSFTCHMPEVTRPRGTFTLTLHTHRLLAKFAMRRLDSPEQTFGHEGEAGCLGWLAAPFACGLVSKQVSK